MGIYDELSKLSESPPSQVSTVQETKKEKKETPKPKKPSHRDTTTPRHHGITSPRYHGTTVELVRKAVKEFGKEAATHRFTIEEKKAIADIIYAYKGRGMKTSENEITRIAVNFIVHDYRQNGENSILHEVLKALNE